MLTHGKIAESVYAPVEAELQLVIANLASVSAERNGDVGSDGAIEARLAHVLATTGKRVRPAITLLASLLWDKQDHEKAVTMATAVELLHIATLVHDDTVDSADQRRGHATASNLWGDRIAVLLGDYLFAASARFVCDTGNIRLVRRFAKTIMELSQGELTESLQSGKAVARRDVYLDRIYNKTASLFSTAAESGAVLGAAGDEDSAALRDFGTNVGLAYQIMDDILDFMGTPETLGKPACSDLRQGILTLPAIVLLERSPEDNPIVDMFTQPPEDREIHLNRALELIRTGDILDECLAFADGHITAALDLLAKAPDSRARESLEAIARFANARSS